MNDSDREILGHFARTRGKTIELLERIPDELLHRTPTGEERPLGSLFGHIASAVDFWMEKCLHDGGLASNAGDGDKASLIKSLDASRERLTRYFYGEDGAAMHRTYSRPPGTRAAAFPELAKEERFSGRNRVLYLTQHEYHRRGKIVLALRQWGFTDVPFIPY